jgi:hypothetical protein
VFFRSHDRHMLPHLDKEYLFLPNCLTNEALPRAPTGDTEGVNAKKMRNKKKAFAAMALVALATLRLRQSRTLTPLIKVRIQVPQPQNLSIPLRIFDFYDRRNSPDTFAR